MVWVKNQNFFTVPQTGIKQVKLIQQGSALCIAWTALLEVCEWLLSSHLTHFLQVVLSGGCCRIPVLRQQIQDYFSAAEFINGIADDEAIAIGCAIEVIFLISVITF